MGQEMTRRRSRRWDLVALSLGAISATVSILFLAWLEVWFQLFGERADRGDYLQASGLYAGGLVWLGMAGVVAWVAGGPTWLRWWCWGATGLFAALLLSARSEAANRDAPASGFGHQSFGAGFETAIVQMPWSWLVVVGAFLALTRHRRTASPIES